MDIGEWRETAVRVEVQLQSQKFEFKQFGIRLHVLQPGEPNSLYHSESQQEAFLVYRRLAQPRLAPLACPEKRRRQLPGMRQAHLVV